MLALPILKTSAKSVQTTAEVSRKYYVLTNLSTRTYDNEYTYLQKQVRRIHIDFGVIVEEPFRAILLPSPGHKP